MPYPRIPVLVEPTPLVPARRASQALGVELWIKRDDLAGPSLGGNKARQLEYYFGAAEAQGADTILITGAVQSNFARLAAAVACARGLDIVVQLENRVPDKDVAYHKGGNVLLSQILGADIVHYPVGEDEAGADAALYAKAEELRQKGRKPYVIPLAESHPPLGALGYIRGAKEILAQAADFDAVVVGSGSGATHCGLLAGLRAGQCSARVIGACVRRSADLQRHRIARILNRLADLDAAAGNVLETDIELWDGALNPGYGQLGPPGQEAIALLARTEGLMLDPVYTAKAFAAIPAALADGRLRKGDKVCFVHTGGLAALFAYPVADILAK